MAELRTVSLDEQLCSVAEQRFALRFATLEELLNTMLRELLREDAIKLDEEEQRVIEERLRALGYV